jgi:AcrR family transcriptional regulator
MKAIATGQRILDATLALVAEKGYLGATTREIAQRAGVTELTLFRHFGSKEKLFESCLERNSFLPDLKELLPDVKGLPYEEALRTIGRRFLLSLRERKAVVKIIQAELTRYPGRMKRIYGQFMDEMLGLLARYFTSLQRQGRLRRFPADLAARMFLGMLFAYFRNEEIMRGTDITKQGRMDRTVAGFVDIFVNGTLPVKNGNGKRRRT